ncbi:MAG TPA: type II toxin-antitoxin system HigB family toxin [Planctomycetaceae bacterium]
MPGHQDAQSPLLNWYDTVKGFDADWHNFADVKAMFGNASVFKDCVIFNIGGNKYRLITRLRYEAHKIFILHVLTHRDYDRDLWKSDCECQA